MDLSIMCPWTHDKDKLMLIFFNIYFFIGQVLLIDSFIINIEEKIDQ